ncbi:protein FAM200A-like [Palaemon carinicauda]|uniref:protein FAM200A-like n=1 Tax=Palaemon carinicauda TaxID=392227 RepID=UPI0035B5ED9E
MTAFKMKLELWLLKIEKNSFALFPQLNTYTDENELNVEDDIIELKQHVSLSAKHTFREMCSSDFWIEMTNSSPSVAKMALKVLIPFATTYECESAFSTLLAIKSKSRNRLEATHDMRVALAETKPKIEELVQAKQMHPSY